MNIIFNLLKKTVTKVVLLIIVLLFLLSLFVFWGWYEKQYNKVWGYYFVYKGDKAYSASKYQKAVDYYSMGLRRYPEHSKARCNLGNIYVAFENYYAATDEYEQALNYAPDYLACRMDLGIILSERMANYDQAIQEYGKIIESHPFLIHLPFIYNNVTSVKLNKGIAYYNTGLAYRGKSIYMGEKTLASHQYLMMAKDAYMHAKKILKKDYDTHYNLALTNHLLGNYRDAGLEYCRAIEYAPLNYEAHYNLALLLRSMKLYKESLIEFEKAGMILDSSGDTTKTNYIYGVLSEVKQRIINQGDMEYLKERTDFTATEPDKIEYKNGKVIVSKESNKEFMEHLKSCPYQKYFKDM
ncbi:MAG: tetratricopeptide repeat protein [Candidatus Gastranaerophilales bacterium]|nr:tetratricopeptide repeat protein [Candidatus Gastranaerophilales bacterium]